MSQSRLPHPNPLFLRSVKLIIALVAKLCFRFSCRKDRQALTAFTADPRPLIVVFNHTSHLDVPVVGLCLDMAMLRRVIMPGKRELFDHPVLAWFMRQGGAIPLKRDMADTSTVRTLPRALHNGRMVIMSPEGTRSADGQVQPFKSGFIKLAHRTHALILPVGIRGAYAALPRDATLPRPRRITAVVGTPIDIRTHLPAHPSADDIAAGAELVRQQVITLCNSA